MQQQSSSEQRQATTTSSPPRIVGAGEVGMWGEDPCSSEQRQATTISSPPRIVGAGEVGMWGWDPCGRPRTPCGKGDRKGPIPSLHLPRPYGDEGPSSPKSLPIRVEEAGSQRRDLSGREHEDSHESGLYSVGVDGGGTKTLAIVVDAQGRECGRGLAGSANYNVVGLEQAVRHIHSAVEQAASMAGCQLPLSRAWLGIASIDRPTDQDALLPHLHSLANIINLTNDAQLVLSGLDKAVGVALIAGTGSIALGRDAQGNTARAGGWGHVLGDEGSGYTIGRMALQVAVRAADGRGPATTLLELIMQHWQLHTASDIIGQVYPAEDKAGIAHVSALVFTAARAGDLLARKIIQQAANELALAAAAVGAALSFPADQLPLALGGGLLVHEKDFRQQVIRRIRRQRPNGQVVVVDQPALSAARAALDWHTLPA